MTITIRRLKRRPGGRESIRERDFDADSISIGRDSANDVALPDLRLSLRHASLSISDDNGFVLETFDKCTALVNRRPVTGKTVKVKPGSTIRLGRYELRIDKDNAKGTLAATIEQVDTDEQTISADDEFKVFNPAAALPSKRVMSWYFTAFVLAFLVAIGIKIA